MTHILEHCNLKDSKFNLKENEFGTKVLSINNITIFLTEKQARELCETLEKGLYDEPTYEQLQKENMSLISEIEKLKEEPYRPEKYDLNYEIRSY